MYSTFLKVPCSLQGAKVFKMESDPSDAAQGIAFKIMPWATPILMEISVWYEICFL